MLFPATASPGVPTDPGRPEPRPACPRSVPCRAQPRCRAGRGCPGREAGLVGRDRTHGCGRSRLLVPGNETTQLRAGKRRRDTWVVDQKGLYFGNEATSPSASRCSPAGLSRVHRRREGRRSLSDPPLARSRDKTRMSAAHSHASHPHPPGRHRPLAGALVPRAPSPARRRRRGAAGLRPLVPSLPHVPEPLRRCDSAFVPRSRDTRRREQLTPQRLRARYANDVATTTRIPAAERHLRLPRTLPGRAVRTPGPPPRA